MPSPMRSRNEMKFLSVYDIWSTFEVEGARGMGAANRIYNVMVAAKAVAPLKGASSEDAQLFRDDAMWWTVDSQRKGEFERCWRCMDGFVNDVFRCPSFLWQYEAALK